jgi:tripartite-type tricarboxylate transporter receptor subunit TctC
LGLTIHKNGDRNMKKVVGLLVKGMGILFAVTAFAAGAQEYPNAPIQLLIPHAAGGGTDVLARIVAEQLSLRLGQRVVPENRPGAGTALASGYVARAAPTGYTLLLNTAAHALNATMNKDLQFDPVNDFEFVGKIGQVGLLLMVNPQYVKAKDVRELVNFMQSTPGNVQYGSAGIGTPMHLGGELLKVVTKTDAVHVPYKGESAVLSDLLGGRLTFMLCSITMCGPRAQDGSLRALAVTSASRSALVPNIPTIAEAGFRDVEINSWFFIAAPKSTPESVVNKLNKALNEMLADEKFRKRAQAMGVQPETHTTPAATKALVQSEIEKWRPIAKAASGATN